MPPDTNGWPQWGVYLLEQLKDVRDKQIEILQEIATLKVKSSVWGLVGGLIPATIALIYFIVKLK